MRGSRENCVSRQVWFCFEVILRKPGTYIDVGGACEAELQGGRGAAEGPSAGGEPEDGGGEPAAPVEHRLGGQPAGRGTL